MSTQTTIGKTTLRLVVGDIAQQDTDAVVTAAHWRLNKGMGTEANAQRAARAGRQARDPNSKATSSNPGKAA